MVQLMWIFEHLPTRRLATRIAFVSSEGIYKVVVRKMEIAAG